MKQRAQRGDKIAAFRVLLGMAPRLLNPRAPQWANLSIESRGTCPTASKQRAYGSAGCVTTLMHKWGIQVPAQVPIQRPAQAADGGPRQRLPAGCWVGLLCSKAINAAEPLHPSSHCSCISGTCAPRGPQLSCFIHEVCETQAILGELTFGPGVYICHRPGVTAWCVARMTSNWCQRTPRAPGPRRDRAAPRRNWVTHRIRWAWCHGGRSVGSHRHRVVGARRRRRVHEWPVCMLSIVKVVVKDAKAHRGPIGAFTKTQVRHGRITCRTCLWAASLV